MTQCFNFLQIIGFKSLLDDVSVNIIIFLSLSFHMYINIIFNSPIILLLVISTLLYKCIFHTRTSPCDFIPDKNDSNQLATDNFYKILIGINWYYFCMLRLTYFLCKNKCCEKSWQLSIIIPFMSSSRLRWVRSRQLISKVWSQRCKANKCFN